MGYRTNEDKRGHLRTHLERGCFSTFICPGFKKESNMDRWIYVTESGRKESGFENLKTRFQDCNLSRKQENKLPAKKTSCLCGMNENKEARKRTGCLCRKIARNKESEKEVIPAFELSTWNERKPSVNLYGWDEIKMYHKKELLQ